ncbi:hypothetical protein E4T66_14315 [Sinimarinibacterium sp. CAU 1509]|uniref:hypothetical protein n=1 Tax=Sinimarinibacterium sp. CAU 1509 TaxID=2562283 RepID=UPI0010AD6449|nr:hypothetical protein [Sinimarinibacterium sp. CAU 1509]TJY58776.1 hypothetical protein E4T66_14315 [Sinimarinibacterium sp. CAU 1509]
MSRHIRGRARSAVLLALVVLGAGASYWALRPQTPTEPTGPSILDRAQQATSNDPAHRSAHIIPDDDLPPEGTRSLFDHLIAQNDALPYPFEALVDLIEKQSDTQPPVRLMIPFGRSLLKAQADFSHPRVLVAADFQASNTPANLGLVGRGQLFLGFVENAHEIEVISYNEAAGRYEFQLVQDYAADGQRRIVYARRAVCLTCHQGGSPIFPQRPWNETNAQPEIAAHIVTARGDADYLGVPPQTALGMPERFDELTDVGSFVVTTQRIWLDGCGDNTSCRRQILKLALRYAWDPGRFDAAGSGADALRALQRMQWPDAGIAVPESDLRNRDPLVTQRGWRGFLHTLFAPAPIPGAGAGARNNDDLEAFDKLPRLPATLDPLTPRPPKRWLGAEDIDGVYGIAALFSTDDVATLERRAGHDWAVVDAAVDALPDVQLSAQPFSRVRMMQALAAALPAQDDASTPGYCCLDVSAMSPPVAATEPPLELAADSPLQPFTQYCFACHRGNPNAKLNFMGGDDEAAVKANIEAKSEIRDALDWERYRNTDKAAKLMPPADSPQHAKLQAALTQDPELLTRMRDQVPGLFDF